MNAVKHAKKLELIATLAKTDHSIMFTTPTHNDLTLFHFLFFTGHP